MSGISKVTENLLRRVAGRRGYELSKNRGRDPAGLHFGEYQLTSIETGAVYGGSGIWLTATAVARALGREDLAGMISARVGEHQPTSSVVSLALKLVPELADESDTNWVVEPTADGATISLPLSKERARALANAILDAVGRGDQSGN